MANRPFYRYGGHIELISLTEYWDAQGAWAWSDILVRYLRSLFGSKQQKKKEAIKIVDTPKKLVWSFTVLFLTYKAIIITSKHGTKFFFPIKILFLENFKNNCPEKLA